MTEIIMPKMGLNMSEGLIVEWLVGSGAEVSQGQEIASIESEKVVNHIQAETGGTVHIAVEAGRSVAVGTVIGYLLRAGEKVPDAPAGQPRISPAARRRAQQLGLDLGGLSGTGPGGRISIEDVETAAAGRTAAAGAAQAAGRVPFGAVRKAIAAAMSTSRRETAGVTLTTEVDCLPLVAARQRSPAAEKLSYNAIMIHVLAGVLKRFPYMNSRLIGETILQLAEVNIGLAVQAEQGLMVPVIHGAGGLSPTQIQGRIRELVGRVRNRAATPDDFRDGSFTLTNLGAYGIDAFTPIINPGQTAILGVGRIAERAVVRAGKVEIRPTCVLSLTFDHRLVDGAPAAEFLRSLRDSLEGLA